MVKWRYFVRTGPDGAPFDIYRIPANGKPFRLQEKTDVEKLRPDASWSFNPNAINSIWRELYLGGFSEQQDEISEERVQALYDEWSKGEWPGVP